MDNQKDQNPKHGSNPKIKGGNKRTCVGNRKEVSKLETLREKYSIKKKGSFN